eukprot:SAG11_NODE_370_length_10058_cov_108.790943_1_plen_107_part_00
MTDDSSGEGEDAQGAKFNVRHGHQNRYTRTLASGLDKKSLAKLLNEPAKIDWSGMPWNQVAPASRAPKSPAQKSLLMPPRLKEMLELKHQLSEDMKEQVNAAVSVH